MSPQQSIAHYRIVAKLGEGGMGAVYRATDTKLNRDVAVKVLPESFAQDAARMQRFEREAQILAALNHPNIAAIYSVEKGAIVMELVEGSDLAGPLPPETVIDYARQIATGLEAAHEKGIIHRDLKPANIKVTPEGMVKILDFGLAKARDESTAGATDASPTISPTLSISMTQAGMILGTAAYMSPEQARGKPVDRRADIWAFGVILFELLTGRHPYGAGETVTDTLAAIVLKDADFGALPKETPPRLRRLIERCMRKDPKLRLRDIGDARMLLDEPEPDSAAIPAAPPVGRRWMPWTIAAAGLAIAAATAGIAWKRSTAADSGPGTVRFSLPLPQGTSWSLAGSATEFMPSPDGRNLAMVVSESGRNALWIHPLGATSAHRIDNTEDAVFPFWSPDGQSIAFFTEGVLRRMPISGGAAVKICELPATSSRAPNTPGLDGTLLPGGDGGTWNQEGVIVFGPGNAPLLRVAAGGGTATPVTVLQTGETAHQWPQFLADGRHVLYQVRGTPDVAGIYVQELGSSRRVRVLQTTARAMWAPPGFLLYTRETSLFAQRMSPGTFQLEGEPVSLAENVRVNQRTGRSTFAVSRNGVLVYRSDSSSERQITWRDRNGNVLTRIGKPVPSSTIRLSPDEKSAAMTLGRNRVGDTWVMELASGVITPVTHGGKVYDGTAPVWSPDSKRLAVALMEGGVAAVTIASGQVEVLTPEPLRPASWSSDGLSILCQASSSTRLDLLSLAPGRPLRTIISTPYTQFVPNLSPDGKYVTYRSTETGSTEIYVAAFPSFAAKQRVSTGGGNYPRWGKNGKTIYYRAPDGMLTEAEIRTAPDLKVGERKQLFKFGTDDLGNGFGVSGDGQRFLISELTSARTQEVAEIMVVLDWMAEMKR